MGPFIAAGWNSRALAVGITLFVGAATVTVASQPPGAAAGSQASRRAQAVDGKAVYLANCKQCHGVLGVATQTARRQYEKIPALNDPAMYTRQTDAQLIAAVTAGKGEMKGFAAKLSTAEIAASVEYIHTLAPH